MVDESVSAEPVPAAGLTPGQVRALDAWHRRSNLPILLAAIVPLVVSSPQVRAVAIVVGLGSGSLAEFFHLEKTWLVRR